MVYDQGGAKDGLSLLSLLYQYETKSVSLYRKLDLEEEEEEDG